MQMSCANTDRFGDDRMRLARLTDGPDGEGFLLMIRHDSLAVDFFLLAHDPFTDGRMIVNGEILGCGLVGGKLADLVLDRRLGIDGELVIAVDGQPSGDSIDDFVVETVRSQSSVHPVRRWIEALQDDLYEYIVERVVSSGILRREEGGRRFRRQPDRFPAQNLLAAAAPQQQLLEMVRSPKDLTLRAGMLLALLGALGLDRLLGADGGDQTRVREIILEIEDHLPTSLRAVHGAVKSVAGDAAIRSR
jgi:hypothetical protein